jgi:hypothetical protein
VLHFGDCKLFHLINFHLHNVFPNEINYEIHDKIKILATVDGFEKWRNLLKKA